jgi:hypothetical protein
MQSLHHTAMKNAKGAVSALSHIIEKSFSFPEWNLRKKNKYYYKEYYIKTRF